MSGGIDATFFPFATQDLSAQQKRAEQLRRKNRPMYRSLRLTSVPETMLSSRRLIHRNLLPNPAQFTDTQRIRPVMWAITDAGSDLGGGKNVSNNNVNIDKSRGDVNINVDNSKDIKVRNTKNTSVRHNNYRPYSRPPYVYGGFHYRCYNPYFYHPYRPFYWGPRWHPWGFFIATLAATAIIVSFADADLPPMLHSSDYFVMNTAI